MWMAVPYPSKYTPLGAKQIKSISKLFYYEIDDPGRLFKQGRLFTKLDAGESNICAESKFCVKLRIHVYALYNQVILIPYA